jgi:membrane-associated phospholipid phosphatase
MRILVHLSGSRASVAVMGFGLERWWPLAAGGVLLLVVFGGLWLWMVRHEGDLKGRWRAFVSRPRVAAFARRFERQLRFLQNRLTPGGYLGLHLTVGALIVLGAGAGFAEIAEALKANETMVQFDHQVSDWMQRHGTPAITRAAYAVTALGSMEFVGGVSAVVAGVLFRRRAWYRLLAFGLAVVGGGAVNYLLKVFYQRPRPVFENPLVMLDSYSFPSGHMMGAALLYGALALSALLYAKEWRWRWRLSALFAAGLLIGLVGFTRIYLGAHFLSDVIGAAVIAVAWLAATHTGVEIFRLREAERRRQAG